LDFNYIQLFFIFFLPVLCSVLNFISLFFNIKKIIKTLGSKKFNAC